MASDRDFLTDYGWAFVQIEEARKQIDAAPEAVRIELRSMVGRMEQDLHDDLTRAVNRAAAIARRIAAIAESAKGV